METRCYLPKESTFLWNARALDARLSPLPFSPGKKDMNAHFMEKKRFDLRKQNFQFTWITPLLQTNPVTEKTPRVCQEKQARQGPTFSLYFPFVPSENCRYFAFSWQFWQTERHARNKCQFSAALKIVAWKAYMQIWWQIVSCFQELENQYISFANFIQVWQGKENV